MKPLADLSDEALAHLARRAGQALPDAPPWLVGTALAMWRAPAVAPGLGRRIAAVLGFDSWARSPALALRSVPLATRQWLFSAGERDIDLRVTPVEGAAGHYTITGQVLGPGEVLLVTLARDGAEPVQVTPDDFGEFRFADLAAGRCAITLRVDGDLIELPEVEVGGEAPP